MDKNLENKNLFSTYYSKVHVKILKKSHKFPAGRIAIIQLRNQDNRSIATLDAFSIRGKVMQSTQVSLNLRSRCSNGDVLHHNIIHYHQPL